MSENPAYEAATVLWIVLLAAVVIAAGGLALHEYTAPRPEPAVNSALVPRADGALEFLSQAPVYGYFSPNRKVVVITEAGRLAGIRCEGEAP